MLTERRRIAVLALALAALPPAFADEYPNKIVNLIVPAAPGGAVDTNARVVSDALQKLWGHPVVVQYKAGANTLIGTDFVAKAPADGYTLLMTSASFTVLPNLVARMPYEESDLVPVTLVSQTPAAVFVSPSLPVKNIAELISYGQSHPGTLSFGAPDATGAFVGHLFNQLAGTNMQYVPYKGFGPMATDLMGGHLPVGISGASTVRPLALTGKVKVLGIASARPFAGLPDAPALAKDKLRSFEASVWFGLFAPRGTPTAIVAKVHADIAKVLADPAVRRRLTDTGAEVGNVSQADFAALVRSELTKWKAIASAAGVKPE
ncbi:tripartite tricarboxylate transporter substrate-binding protein [Variovorax guangxiensis]|uniref:Bug family tripartite tricarboxylate transporter substrate binding protein n=1 Tax=Variovorax guangxiensis TaxID=1775474 RepID=UPI00285C913D|nr:tripartite tricarboxylate transporter substrate-binding protein [Variovorax guangxiensis]MDR6858686.1 tripartite-type tricarboxylate transporter receptor subunit TctC [Variovorax guangxiensis]